MGLMTHTRAGLMTRYTHRGLVWLETHLLQGRLKGYGWVSFSNKTGAPKPTFLNVQIFSIKIYSKPLSTLSGKYTKNLTY
jgi:hypothetical protein